MVNEADDFAGEPPENDVPSAPDESWCTPTNNERLPPGQPYLETTNTVQFRKALNVHTHPSGTYHSMALIVGAPGCGKTIAILAYLETLQRRAHTRLPAAIRIRLKAVTARRTIARTILLALGERPTSTDATELTNQAIKAIQRNHLELLIVDEADYLTKQGYDTLRQIFDETLCQVIVVGLPRLKKVVEKHPQFASRIGLRLTFVQPELEEVLDLILPGLVYERWQYDPQKPEDRNLGTYLWQRAGQSLRTLRTLLSKANTLAIMVDEPHAKITRGHIDDAVWMIDLDPQREAQ